MFLIPGVPQKDECLVSYSYTLFTSYAIEGKYGRQQLYQSEDNRHTAFKTRVTPTATPTPTPVCDQITVTDVQTLTHGTDDSGKHGVHRLHSQTLAASGCFKGQVE